MPTFSPRRTVPGSSPLPTGQRFGLPGLAFLLSGWHLLGALAGLLSYSVVEKYSGRPILSITMSFAFFLAYAACLPGLYNRKRNASLVVLGLVCLDLLTHWIDAILIQPRPGLPTATLAGTILFAVYTALILPRILKRPTL